MATPKPLDKMQLAAQLWTRGLVRTVADHDTRCLDDDHSDLLETLANILNASEAPPVGLHIDGALAELQGTRFFLVQDVLCGLIPLLNVDQDVLLAFVSRLLDAGGNDLAAGAPSTAFGEWTKKDSARPFKVYEAARIGNNLALRQLSTVLRVNIDVEEALAFARAAGREAKLAAISALGAMELGERYDEVFDTLLQGASSDDKQIALRSLEAGYRAAAGRKVSARAGFDEQLERVLQTRDPFEVHLAADLLWLHRDGLSENAIDLCLDAVADVDPNNTGTISHIDHATYQLVRAGRAEHVVRLISKLIDRSDGRITLDSFRSTYHALQNSGADVLGAALVYWLLNGGIHTRRCVASEVCDVGNDVPSFSIPASSLPPEPSDQLFLCRKAIGWFFIDPLAAVAIPLGVLRDGSPDIANGVLDLIYDPLLLSYGGKLKDYLERYVADSEKSSSGLAELLARKIELQGAMEGIERLVELRPSETQREAERVQWHEQMERGIEQGRRKSFLDDLVSKQYILYGRSSLTPIYDGDGNTHLSEIQMKSISVSSELPLLSIVDPIGLDNVLVHFKFERRNEQ